MLPVVGYRPGVMALIGIALEQMYTDGEALQILILASQQVASWADPGLLNAKGGSEARKSSLCRASSSSSDLHLLWWSQA